jgi:hypothetical protein
MTDLSWSLAKVVAGVSFSAAAEAGIGILLHDYWAARLPVMPENPLPGAGHQAEAPDIHRRPHFPCTSW